MDIKNPSYGPNESIRVVAGLLFFLALVLVYMGTSGFRDIITGYYRYYWVSGGWSLNDLVLGNATCVVAGLLLGVLATAMWKGKFD